MNEESKPAPRAVQCAGCGYSLEGLSNVGRCPECGHSISARAPEPTRLSRAASCCSAGLITFLAGLDLALFLIPWSYHEFGPTEYPRTVQGLSCLAIPVGAFGALAMLLPRRKPWHLAVVVVLMVPIVLTVYRELTVTH